MTIFPITARLYRNTQLQSFAIQRKSPDVPYNYARASVFRLRNGYISSADMANVYKMILDIWD